MSISQVSSQTMSAELLEEPHAKEAISQTDATEALATAEPVWLERLASDPKLLNTQAILAPFARGEAETAVIVTLEPTPAAHDLATQSADALNRPSAFDLTESPVFFDLQDQTIRTQLRETVTQAVGQFIANQPKAGLTVTQRFSYQFGFAARVSPAALEQLLADPAVLRVEEDGLMEPHLRQGIPLMAADTPSATFTGSGLSIAIVDTGIDTSHPQLGGGSSIFNSKVIGGYDTGDNDADPRPNSNTGEAHGTACAGIAAGDLGDSGDYIGGVAPGAKLYALKITAGDGGSASDSAMIAAWEWAISHKNDDPANPILVISTSFGGGGYSSACDSYKPGLTTAAANAVAAGITIFASSGNDGFCSYISSPACISHVNSVGAVYDANIGDVGFCVNASYSCATPQYSGYCSSGYNAVFENTAADKVTAYSNSASFLTLFAPSHNAYTTDIKGAGGYASGDYDDAFGGTSAACPYAAGAAAVLQSAAKAKTGSYLTPAQVKSYLTSYGTTITDGKVTSVQKPRINLASAVNALPLTQSTVSVTASDPTATEANLTTGTFTFSRTGDTSAALMVNYSVSGTATAGSDYTALGTSVSFAAGSSTATKTVTPLQDSLIESDETVILTLAVGSGYTVGTPASATVTLSSDDTNTVTVTATDATATEAGLTTGTFTFSRTGDSSAALTVNYTVTGSATSGSDYVALGTSVTFAAGSSTATQTVTPLQDTLGEADETVILTLNSGSGYSLGTPASATVTIASDDGSGSTTVTVAATDATATEAGPDTGTFTFSRSGDTSTTLTVNYTVSGTATAASDYIPLGTSVTFAAGSSTALQIVTSLQDTLVEPNETVILTLNAGSGYSLGTPASATVSIADAQAGALNARVGSGSLHSLLISSDGRLWAWGENALGQLGDGTTTDSSLPKQVLSDVAAVAAGWMHTLAVKTDGGLWAWGANNMGQLGDGTTTNSSSPKQVLTGGAALGASLAAGTYHSLGLKSDGSLWAWGWNVYGQLGDGTNTDSSTPKQILTGVAAVEVGAAHSLALKTDGSLWAWGYNVSGELGDGTTTNSSTPKQILTGVIAVAAGSDHGLAIKSDGSLWAWGGNAYGQLGDGTTTNSTLPKQILTGVVAVAAGHAYGFTLALKNDGSLWAWGHNSFGELGDGTTTNRSTPKQILAGVAAVAAGDYHGLALKTDGSLWAWGDNASGQLGDGTTSRRLSPVRVKTNIVSLTPTDDTATEADLTTGTFTFSRTGDTSAALIVNYMVTGTATAGSDYTALGTSVSFAAGASTVTKTLTPVQDTLIEADETIILTLATGSGYTVGTPSSATVTLTSDDSNTVTVSATDATATEADLTTGTFTFSRTGDTSAALTVNYTVSGTATAGSDYTALGTSVTFAAGATSATQTVNPVQDTLVESDESVFLTLSAGTGYTVGSPASATVTLTSDDPQDHTLTVTMEGTGTGRITSSPAGIDCGGDCSQSYANDSTIVLTASPGGGSDFAGWSGSCLGLATNCAIYLDEVKQVSASFTQRQNHSPTFEMGDGQVLTPISFSATINDLALQPDGKIVAVGSSQNYNGGPTDLALARYNADGSLDTTFGTGGKLITSLTEYSDGGFSVIVQPDGKIVIGGYGGERYTDSDPLDFALVRYLPDGSLDTSFATNGVVLLPPLAGANRWGFDLALQPDGKILFGGAQLVRFLSDGSLDATFGHNGQLAPVTDGSRTKIALQPDGKILVAGNTVGTNNDFALERYNRDGSLDTSFATSGKLTLDIQRYRDDVEDLALQIDGKILLAGFSTDADGNEDFALVRLNSDGSLDTGFGNDGMVTTELGALQERGHSMALQPDGKILVGGMYRHIVDGNAFALVRYTSNGSLDTSFGMDGKLLTKVGDGTYSNGNSIYLQPDGKILFGGGAFNNSPTQFALVRYHADGSLDAGFDSSKTNTLDGTARFNEGSTPVVLDTNVRVYDADLSALGHYGGAVLTLARNGGANAQDLFSAKPGGTLAPLTPGADLVIDSETVGTVTQNSGGTLTLTFNGNASQDLVDAVLQQLAYANSASPPPASVRIDWHFSDGNTGLQGTGGALSVDGLTTVAIAAKPIITVTASDPTATETDLTTGTFTFSRTGDTSAALTVNYTVSGTATAGSDYTALGTSVTFAAGATSATQTVNPVQDTLVESDESVFLTLSAGTGYTVGSPASATVTLTSDDIATYLVTATAGSGGSITPTSITVLQGETTTFTVSPNAGFSIASVTGCNGELSSNVYTTGKILATCEVTASFSPNTYAITATASPVAGGTVSCTPNPVNHGGNSTCTGTANAGYTFKEWTGDCTGATCALSNVTAAKAVTATFTPTYTLTVAKAGNGSGTVSGGGSYVSGAPVTLTATADAGSIFTGWSPSPCAASFAMPANDLTCNASFSPNGYTLEVTTNPASTGSGTVTGGGTYPAGTRVTPSAIPDQGSAFAGWEPASCGAPFALTADTVCQATFNLTPPPQPVTVFADSFESTSFTGRWTQDSQNDWFVSTQRRTVGSRSAEVDGSASNAQLISVPIATGGASSATITFSWFNETSLDLNEYLAFDVSTDGGTTWTEQARLRANQDPENAWRPVQVNLTGLAPTASLRLRFRGTMSDSTEDSNLDNVIVTVNPPPVANQAPIAHAGGPYHGYAGRSLVFSATGSSDADGTLVSYVWDFGDGNRGVGATASHTYASPGDYEVTLTVTDNGGATAMDVTTATLAVPPPNQPPQADAGGPYTGTTGQALTVSAVGSTDADGSIVRYNWDFGDGTTGTGETASHTYTMAGSYTLTVTVSDDAGDTDVATTTATVVSAPVTVFADSFESTSFTGRWTQDSQNGWFVSTQRRTVGSRSAEVDGSASNAQLISVPIATGGASSATITFSWFNETSLDLNEYLAFDVSTDGGTTWTEQARLRANQDPENAWRPVQVNLTGLAPTASLRLRFRGTMSDSTEDANLDNVIVTVQ